MAEQVLAAHLAYLRREFVERRRWLDEYAYSDLVALCQFLPGPASSQVGMAIGLKRAGWAGMLAAWVAFTLPTAVALGLFAAGLAQFGWLSGSAAIHGLKVAAVAVIAQAIWGMGRSLCPDRTRAALAVAAALVTLAVPGALGQVAAILLGAVIGAATLQVPARPALAVERQAVSRRAGYAALALFVLLLAALPAWAALTGQPLARQLDGFYRAGALVFGGGHVVLPLLESAAVGGGMVSDAEFLAGYGAAQAMPGPLFGFAGFLGAMSPGPLSGWAGALAMLVAIFRARPSPFYVMDEVEAALDDTNLRRLISLFEQLRDKSQLIVITHQKPTMEVADALYGVTMRGDGITTVISQRMRGQELAASSG